MADAFSPGTGSASCVTTPSSQRKAGAPPTTVEPSQEIAFAEPALGSGTTQLPSSQITLPALLAGKQMG